MDYQEEKKYVGNQEQLFCVQKVKLEDGKAEGVTMLEIRNRSGMQFAVNTSRGMDIPYLSFWWRKHRIYFSMRYCSAAIF